MKNTLLVFREQNLFFGIRSNDFEQYFPLNKVWISQANNSSQVWRFEGKEKKEKGCFIHPGSLFGFSKFRISQTGVIFLKNISNQLPMGILMNEFLMKISLKKIGTKKIDIEQLKKFPTHLPKSAFHTVQRYKRKNIFIIDPLMLFKAYDIAPS